MRGYILLLVLFPAALAQPTDEVHVSSRPYLPFQLKTEATTVQVAVVLRDGKGRAVSGLQKDDFRLTDQGKDRTISGFAIDTRDIPGGTGAVAAKGRETATDVVGASAVASPSSHPPRFILMFFEDITTAPGDLMRMKRDAARFVQDGMSAGDRIAIATSTGGRLTGYVEDKKQIAAAIAKVQPHQRFSLTAGSTCPRITTYDAYLIANQASEEAMRMKIAELRACSGAQQDDGTVKNPAANPKTPPQLDPDRNVILQQAEMIWNQVRIASQSNLGAIGDMLNDLAAQKGTRMLLLISSGFLTGTLETEEDALADRAVAAGVVINTMDAKGIYVEPPVRSFDEMRELHNTPGAVTAYENMTANAAAETPTAVLADLAQATGGLFFHHNNDFSFGFRELGSIPEITYLLAFHPDDAGLDGKYHKLKVRLASSNSYTIEARPGYFATAHNSAATPDPGRAALEREVMKAEPIQQFPAAVQMQYGAKTAAGNTPVHIQMHVDMKALAFGQQNGRHTQRLTFVFALLDPKDNIVSAREGLMEFSLTDAKYQSMQQSGVNATLTLEAPVGSYRLRAVAIEGQGQMAAQAYAVNVQ